MTLLNTLKHIVRHYLRVSLDAFPKKIPKEVQVFRNDCEKLVERYNSLLKEISEYMKDHSKPNHEDSENSAITLSYYDTDSFFLISIKEDLEILLMTVKSCWKKEWIILGIFNCKTPQSNKI